MDKHEINKRVCEILGWEPRHEWMVSKDGGESLCAFTDAVNGPWYRKADLKEWLEVKKIKEPTYFKDAELLTRDIYENVYEDSNHAIRALEEYCKKNEHDVVIERCGEFWYVNFNGYIELTRLIQVDTSISAAICDAIIKMEETKNGN